MASTTRVSRLPARPRSTAERRAYVAATLTGLYASNGQAILHAKNHQYDLALKNMRRVAEDQADEMLRRKA